MSVTPSSGSGTDALSTGGTGPTAQELIRALGKRLQEYVLSVPTAAGGTTTIIDQNLKQYFPLDIAQFYPWVTAVSGADAGNVNEERRAMSWTFSTFTLTLFPPGFSVPVTQGQYELHMRYQRSLILEAINDAVGQLQLSWYREVKDESIVTQQGTWRYTLPNTQHWTTINRIEIQINTDASAVAGGYPFSPADYLNPRIDRSVDLQGNELWAIQFGTQPPPDRILRVWGESFYVDLVQDTDFLPIAGEWERPALSWIFSKATFNLKDWTDNRPPTDQTQTARQKSLDALEQQKNQLLANAPPHKPGKILVPGTGDGYPNASPADYRYLGAFKSAAFIRGGG